MKKTLLLIASVLCVNVFAQEIRYRDVEPWKGDYKGFRTAWDQTGEFCVINEAKQKECYEIAQLGEIKLRDKGQVSADPADQLFLSKLSPEARITINQHYKFYVRYIGLKNTNMFAAHIFFGATDRKAETLFIFGEIQDKPTHRDAHVNAYAHSTGLEAFGWLAAAGTKLGPNPTEKELRTEVTKLILPILKVGENVVTEFINTQDLRPVLHRN